MKDEIVKYILDKLKYCKEHDKENNYYPEEIFLKDEPYILLDYITNLQEELEQYKRYTDETFLYSYEELQDKVISLQEENQKLKGD